MPRRLEKGSSHCYSRDVPYETNVEMDSYRLSLRGLDTLLVKITVFEETHQSRKVPICMHLPQDILQRPLPQQWPCPIKTAKKPSPVQGYRSIYQQNRLPDFLFWAAVSSHARSLEGVSVLPVLPHDWWSPKYETSRWNPNNFQPDSSMLSSDRSRLNVITSK